MRTKSLSAGRDSPVFGRIISLTGGGKYFFDIASLSPTQILAGSADTVVSIIGGVFNANSVPYLNGVAAVTYSLINSAQIDVTIPAALLVTPGSVAIQIRDAVTPGTKFSNIAQFGVAYPLPTFTNHSPAFAYLGTGATVVTVTGTGFFPAGTYATINGTQVAFTYASATSGTITIPAGLVNDADAYAIAMVNPVPGGGASATRTFNVRYRTPAITSKSTSLIPINSGDFVVTLTDSGGGYYSNVGGVWPDGGSIAKVDGVTVSSTWVNATTLQITIPAAVTSVPGVKSITVENPTVGGGGGPSAGSSITVSAPTTSALSWSTRPRGFTEFTVRITGTNFVSTDVGRMRGVSLATTFVNSTTLDVVVSASLLSTAGTDPITVRTLAGYETNGQSFTVLPWSVTDIGPMLRQWLDAAFVTLDGSNRVQSMNDQSGGSRTPTQASSAIRPDYVSSHAPLNNKPAVHVIATRGDVLGGVPWLGIDPVGLITKPTFTMWSALSALVSSQTAANASVVGCDNGNFLTNGTLVATGVRAQDSSGGTVFVESTVNWLTGQAVIHRSRKANGNIYSKANGGAESSIAHSGNLTLFTPANQLIGQQTPTSGQVDAFIGEVITLNGEANWTVQWQVDNYLAGKYATAFTAMGAVVAAPTVSPNTGTQFDVPFQITVTGTGFDATCVVNCDGEWLATIYDSPTQLRAMLTSTSLVTYGVKGITVSNAGGQSPPVALTIAQYVPGAGANLNVISPTTKAQYKYAFTLTCTGTGFTASSVVYSDATPLVTIYDSPTQLRATVPAGIMYTSGNKSITVYDPAGTSGPQLLSVTARTLADVNGATRWYRGDDVATSGAAITQANERLGSGDHAAQATGTKQPTRVAADALLNGQDIMRFDGTSDTLLGSSAVNPNVFSTTAWLGYVVYYLDAITGSAAITTPYLNNNIVGLSASGFFGIAARNTPVLYGYTVDGVYKVAQNTGVAATTPQFAIFARGAGTLDLYINGVLGTSISGVGAAGFSSQVLAIGSSVGANYAAVRIADVLTSNVTPTADDFELLTNYTAARYAIY